MNFLDPRLPERFWSKCIPEPNSGCWLWLAGHNPEGYGSFQPTRGASSTSAHRASYIALVGPIPQGLVLDHRVCKQPCCVNPSHVEPVTIGENVRRGENHHRKKVACKQGHPFDAANTFLRYRRDGSLRQRGCLACAREAAQRARDEAKRQRAA